MYSNSIQILNLLLNLFHHIYLLSITRAEQIRFLRFTFNIYNLNSNRWKPCFYPRNYISHIISWNMSLDYPVYQYPGQQDVAGLRLNTEVLFYTCCSVCLWVSLSVQQPTGDKKHIPTVQSFRERRLWRGECIHFFISFFYFWDQPNTE